MSLLKKVIDKAQAKIPMERQVQGLNLYHKAKRLVVGDNQPEFVEERIPDVNEVALTDIDVSNPFLWRQGQWQPYFKRLRDEAPVHYQANSAFGPYWSVTRYD
ncbi:UNVERIFIED_CONTAM: cytochrome, partial [Salmonella enterica subsp. enterica serovar Weltevreden]